MPRSSPRPAPRQDHISSLLRQQIVGGRLGPGKRLPTRSELQARFKASTITVERALRELIEDGFVQARGPLGTFVVEHPPHTCHYALVFFRRPHEAQWVHFWTTLANEAAIMGAQGPVSFLPFHCTGRAEDDDLPRLEQAVRHRRLAGVLFASDPYPIAGGPVLLAPDLPRVALVDTLRTPGVAGVCPDRDSFLDQAIARFRARGRRRIAVIAGPNTYPGDLALQRLAAAGFACHPWWMQTVALGEPDSARNCAHLLFHAGQHERPDGLLIADDNLVGPATAGLLAAGVRIPHDLEVVAHCNFPWPTASLVPLTRLGFDARRILRTCLDTLADQRRGRKPKVVPIPAEFEDQLRPGPAA